MRVPLVKRNRYKYIITPLKRNINSKSYKENAFANYDDLAKNYSGFLSEMIFSRFKEYLQFSKTINVADIVDVVGRGGLSYVFSLKNNKEVVKVSLENPLQYRKHNSKFDIPFLSQVERYKSLYIVKEPKAEIEGLTDEDVLKVLNKIKKEGYEPSKDLHANSTRQIGRYNGNLYLLDTRCALPRPNFLSRFVLNLCESYKKPIIIDSIEDFEKIRQKFTPVKEALYMHVDETPRRNLTLKQSAKLLYNLAKENVEYYIKVLTYKK